MIQRDLHGQVERAVPNWREINNHPRWLQWLNLPDPYSGDVRQDLLNADDVVAVCAADVVMRPKDWIWPGHLLRGSQELLSGLADLGKSQVQINYIACATARSL
jgi:hypothetical protein